MSMKSNIFLWLANVNYHEAKQYIAQAREMCEKARLSNDPMIPMMLAQAEICFIDAHIIEYNKGFINELPLTENYNFQATVTDYWAVPLLTLAELKYLQ